MKTTRENWQGTHTVCRPRRFLFRCWKVLPDSPLPVSTRINYFFDNAREPQNSPSSRPTAPNKVLVTGLRGYCSEQSHCWGGRVPDSIFWTKKCCQLRDLPLKIGLFTSRFNLNARWCFAKNLESFYEHFSKRIREIFRKVFTKIFIFGPYLRGKTRKWKLSWKLWNGQKFS